MVKNNFTRFSVNLTSYCFIVGLGIFAFPSAVVAQKTDSLQQVKQLDEVQIQQYRLGRQNLSPTPIQILTTKDLKRLNSLTVADAIRYFSGVQLKDYGGIGGLKTVNVRSMGSNHTAVFYDGVAVNSAQNGQVDLGKFSLANMEEISLVSGQSADLLQPAKAYAAASAIFLKTSTPDFSVAKKQTVNVDLKIGDFGLINPSLNYQYKITDKLWGSVSTTYTQAHGRYKFRLTNGVFDTTAVRNNGDVERFRLQAALFGKTKNNAEWNFQGYSFLSERGLPGAIIANKFDYNQRMWDQNYALQGAYRQEFKKLQILFNGKLGYDYTRYLDPEFVKIDGVLDNRFKEREGYLSAAAKYKIDSNLQLSFSSDYQYQSLDANLYRFAYPHRNTFLNVLSAAYQTQRFTLQGNLLSTTIIERVEVLTAPGSQQVFSPTLMFSWKVADANNYRIRGFYKDIFRMPTFNDLYYTFVGNTLLNPEKTKQYDIGFTYGSVFKQSKVQFIELQVDAYYNEVKNKIVAQPGANLMRWIMFNLDKVEIKGLELNAKTSVKISKQLNLGFGLNYTYQQAIDVSNSNATNFGDQIPYVPQHSGSFMAKADYDKWRLNYSFIYTGARYNQKHNSVYNYMKPWYTHDISLGYAVERKHHIIKLNLEVNNLLNQYFDVIPNFPMPGRNYRLSLNYTI